jgi:hypothetical protein
MTQPDSNTEHDAPVGERVFAPASERVPVDPVPGHREVIEHPDASTPERLAAVEPPEPTFTRVERPSNIPYQPAAAPMSNPNYTIEPTFEDRAPSKLPFGIGTAVMLACGGLGVWAYLRWQNERNKPINRLRRQAYQAAAELRERVPSADELAQPGSLGALAATLLSIAVVVARQILAQQSRKSPVETMADVDWQHRLLALKDRWSPRRVELEKFSISRH